MILGRGLEKPRFIADFMGVLCCRMALFCDASSGPKHAEDFGHGGTTRSPLSYPVIDLWDPSPSGGLR